MVDCEGVMSVRAGGGWQKVAEGRWTLWARWMRQWMLVDVGTDGRVRDYWARPMMAVRPMQVRCSQGQVSRRPCAGLVQVDEAWRGTKTPEDTLAGRHTTVHDGTRRHTPAQRLRAASCSLCRHLVPALSGAEA